MSDLSTQATPPPATVGRSARTVHWLALAVATAVVFLWLPHVWQRGYSAWLALHQISLNWGAQGFLAVVIVVALLAWIARTSGVRYGRSVLIASLFCWLVVNCYTWYSRASILSTDPMLFVWTASSGIWMWWLWGMFFVRQSWRRRLGVLVGLFLIAPALSLAVASQGLDGQGRVTLHWALTPSARAPRANVSPSGELPAAEIEMAASEDDYPAFRGADRLATIEHGLVSSDWSEQEPREVWRRPVGAGWGAFAVAGNQAVTQEQQDDHESIVCYELQTGREIWIHQNPTHFPRAAQEGSSMGGEGPRATPTIDGPRIYALGATGLLDCLDRRDGSELWSVDILQDNDAKSPIHGMAGSPLIVDDLVVVSAGGSDGRSLVAYDRETGQRMWGAGNDDASYASPQLVEIAGVRQILIHNVPGVAAHAVDDGRVLWSHPWANVQNVSCSQPVPLGGDNRRIFLSSGYGKGCTVIELTPPAGDDDAWTVREVWSSRNLKTKFSSAVLHDGCAFGFDDGLLACVDLEDGSRRWKRGRYGHGQLMRVGPWLLLQAESGEVVLVAADGDEHRELARLPALDGKTWNNPALAGRYLLVRNAQEAACYELPVAE